MDPDEALRQAREAVREWEAADRGSEAEWDAAERLSSAFAALDDWLTRGGFPPADWAKNLFTGARPVCDNRWPSGDALPAERKER